MGRPRVFDRDQNARVVLEAMLVGVGMALALREFFDITEPVARYRIEQLHREGYFGQTPHKPIRVTIRPRTLHEQVWIACQSCHHPWPCTEAFAGRNPYRVPLEEQSYSRHDTATAEPGRHPGPR
jgi:hypothetical protein